MPRAYTVGQVNNYIRNMFTQDFVLNHIYIKGEVSNCKYHSTGHIYFSLKDETGTLSCVMFAGSRKGLSFHMKEGQTVIAFGSVGVYPRDGKYQLYASEIRLDGDGVLYQRYLALKAELEEMGMFDPMFKQPVPKLVKRLGVVTAPTGAAVQDIRNIALRRNPYVQIILYPALVQGEGAASSIAKGIHVLDRLGVDVIIAGRGGGSIEDLWAFNEEIVARAIFDCRTPVISAVGHETDTTIADYVADLRAPTPSAAAELAVLDLREYDINLSQKKRKLNLLMENQIGWKKAELEQRKLRLSKNNPGSILSERRMDLANIRETMDLLMRRHLDAARGELEIRGSRIPERMDRRLEYAKAQLSARAGRLDALSPLKRLQQGYSYASDSAGHGISDIHQVQAGEDLTVYVTNGKIRAQVTGTEEVTYGGGQN